MHTKYVTGFEPPNGPLLDPETLRWLTAELGRTELYLEFGCGGTTVLANSLQVHTVSVESDAFYAQAVLRALPHPRYTQIVTPNMGMTGAWGMPLFFSRLKGGRYIDAPFSVLSDNFPDLIFVDGRYRVGCALESARRAFRASRNARLLLDDYALRKEYHAVESYLGSPTRIGRSALFLVGTHDIPGDIVHKYRADPR